VSGTSESFRHSAHDDVVCFTEEQVKTFSDMFMLVDKDGTMTVDCSELQYILRLLGYEAEPSEVTLIMEKYDLDGSGTIDFDEYLMFMEDWMTNDEEQIREAFQVFDREGKGYLTIDELKVALTKYGGEEFTDEEAEGFFRAIDADGDGCMTADEFINYIKSMAKL